MKRLVAAFVLVSLAVHAQEPEFNVALGKGALEHNETGSSDTAIGFYTLNFNVSGNGNTAVGSFALWSNGSGSQNTAIGQYAGTGLLGHLMNTTAIGFGAVTRADNRVQLGNRDVELVETHGDYHAAAGNGFIFKSPNGRICVKLSLGNDGSFTIVDVACP